MIDFLFSISMLSIVSFAGMIMGFITCVIAHYLSKILD